MNLELRLLLPSRTRLPEPPTAHSRTLKLELLGSSTSMARPGTGQGHRMVAPPRKTEDLGGEKEKQILLENGTNEACLYICTHTYTHTHTHTHRLSFPVIHNANIFATWSTSHSSITSKLWNFLSEFYLWHHALKDFVPTPTLYKYPSKISPSVFMTLFFICKYLKRRGLTLHRALPHLSSSEC